ncbi:MAG: transcription elongation factor GreA [Patescibacteria group bacterium]|mgnify:FL=1
MKQYLTKERLEELKSELQKLKKEGRAEVAERLKKAKEYGDLSENSEYADAKEEQARIESNIFKLENMIRNAALIKKSGAKDTVDIGSTIEISKKGKNFKYTIVGSNEARPEANLISNESPLGEAFLGKKTGDIVKIETPNGKTEYKIVKIE